MAEIVKAEASEASLEKIKMFNGHRWPAASEMAPRDPHLLVFGPLCNPPS